MTAATPPTIPDLDDGPHDLDFFFDPS